MKVAPHIFITISEEKTTFKKYLLSENEWKGKTKLTEKYLYSVFSVFRENEMIACAALYNNPELCYNEKRTFLAGNYECINDDSVSHLLLNEVENECRKNAAGFIIGPMNGSTWNSYRFCTERHESPFFLEPDQPEYYPGQFVSYGFEKLADYLSSRQTHLHKMDEKTSGRMKELTEQGIVFRNICKDDFENEMKKIYRLCSKVFSQNFLYTPISENEFLSLYLPVLPVMNEKAVFIAEHDDHIAGFIFGLDDVINKNQKGLIVKTLARDNSNQYKGIANVLSGLITQYASENQYDYLIHALMIESNASVKVSSNYHGKICSRYRLYIKKL